MGWSGWVRVDGNTFTWLGGTGNATLLQSSQVTPTRTVFMIQAGPVLLNVTFLSPIEVCPLLLYLKIPSKASTSLTIWSNNPCHSHIFMSMFNPPTAQHILCNCTQMSAAVSVYSYGYLHLVTFSAEWVSGNRKNIAFWNTTQTGQSVYHQIHRQTPQSMQETANVAEDGIFYYAMRTVRPPSIQNLDISLSLCLVTKLVLADRYRCGCKKPVRHDGQVDRYPRHQFSCD